MCTENLSELATKAGIAVETLSAGAQLSAMFNFAMCVVFSSLAIVAYVQISKYDRHDDDKALLAIVKWAAIGICFLVAACCLYDGLTAYLYPELWTLKKILGK